MKFWAKKKHYLEHYSTFVVSLEIVFIGVTAFSREVNFGISPRTNQLFNIVGFIAPFTKNVNTDKSKSGRKTTLRFVHVHLVRSRMSLPRGSFVIAVLIFSIFHHPCSILFYVTSLWCFSYFSKIQLYMYLFKGFPNLKTILYVVINELNSRFS